jgi:hypothetical protein
LEYFFLLRLHGALNPNGGSGFNAGTADNSTQQPAFLFLSLSPCPALRLSSRCVSGGGGVY